VDTEHIYYQANLEIFREDYGMELPEDKFIEVSLIQGRSVFELAEYKGFSESETEKFRTKRNQRYSELLRKENSKLLIDGVKETLSRLPESLYMGIVTSCRKDHFRIIHQSTGILRHFKFILASGDFEKSKPFPDPYLAALTKSGFKKNECLVVEDSERGLQAARAAGLECVMIPRGLTKRGNFTGACKILDRIEQIVDIL